MNRALKSKIILAFGTQEDFAQAVGESSSMVSNVVRGRRQLSTTKQLYWAIFLDCDISEIFPNANELETK